MQFTTTLSVAFFAALATASQHAPQHFHHRRQLNGTASGTAGGPSTTLTVFATQIHTITSCAPTVTNCPARNQASAGVVVTETIALTTTVCPVAEASAVSSSIISSAIVSGSGGIVAPSATASDNSGASVTSASIIPLTTGGSGAPGAPGAGSSPADTSDTTLTYTIGTGTSTTVITTVIKHTSTATVYATLPAAVENGSGAATTPAAAASDSTTTISGTSTSTKYVTVVAASSAAAGGNSGAGGNSPVSGAASCAPVTVTIALSTVTVTATPTAADVNAATAGNGKGEQVVTSTPAGNVIVSTATVVPLPVSTAAPFGNGTIPASTKKSCKSVFPSGFISKSKPSATGTKKPCTSVFPSGTGVPAAKFRKH